MRATRTIRAAAFPLVCYVVARAVSAVMLYIAARHQIRLVGMPSSSLHVVANMPPNPGYLKVATNWDGQWYEDIANRGYPPVGSGPVPGQYAFYPLYPALCGWLMRLTGAGFEAVAPTLSLVLGGVGVVLTYVLVRRTSPEWVARASCVVLSFLPVAPVLQVAYTESLSLALLATVLLALNLRRYWLAVPATLLLGLSRAVAAPLVVVVAVHLVYRWRHREIDWDRPTRLAGPALTLLSSVVAPFLWPVIAAAMTRRPTAYLDAFREWSVKGSETGGWVVGAFRSGRPLVGVAMLALLGALALILWRADGMAYGPELRTWPLSYLVYVAALSPIGSSIPRYALLLMAPFWPVDAAELRRHSRVAPRHLARTLVLVVAVMLVLQWLWVSRVFVISTGTEVPP